MINESLRKKLTGYAESNNLEIIFFDSPSFDNSIIGVTESGNLIYNYQLMIDEFAADEDCNLLDAEEFIQYNTCRALPYFPEEGRPIIYYPLDDWLEDYGD